MATRRGYRDRMAPSARFAALGLAVVVTAAGCADDGSRSATYGADGTPTAGPSEWFTPAEPEHADAPEPTERERAPSPDSSPPPDWLGTRPLPVTDSGYGEIQPTPPELVDRRLWTEDLLEPPPDDAFHSAVVAVPPDVAERSTWKPECPVTLEELRYVTVSFWGFDGLNHTGEMLLHHSVAEDVVGVFRALHDARFPLEYLLLTSDEHNEQPPTGDGNVSATYNCRPTRGSAQWSEHARGLAVDLNPFHNPYVRGDVILPELAGAYADRSAHRPGMIQPDDVVTRAFADIGWHWGGQWRSLKDYMHFSASGN